MPTELQVKLGPHSRPAYFMGYPDGTKGYHLRDRNSGAFFTARNTVFDENFRSLTHPSDSGSEDEDTPADDPTTSPSVEPPNTAPLPLSASPEAPCHTQRIRIATKAGKAYAEELMASKSRLLSLREVHADHAWDNPLLEGVHTDLREEVSADVTPEASIEEVEPNVDVSEAIRDAIHPIPTTTYTSH
ncbi:hypothetical protein P692DRAFT_20742607 [Suillus brevipes Sb2]|nr:hypothetical protein P692DRAFT_20742607 [Suillus brevipes Sb2]